MVYDVSNRESFENIPRWVEEVRANSSDDPVITLVGNKSDLTENRMVTTEEAQAFAGT